MAQLTIQGAPGRWVLVDQHPGIEGQRGYGVVTTTVGAGFKPTLSSIMPHMALSRQSRTLYIPVRAQTIESLSIRASAFARSSGDRATVV